MKILNLLRAITLYEAKIVWRSWFFRIFAILMLLILWGIDYMLFIMENAPNWMLRSVPAGIPYTNLMLLNIAQGIVALFIASHVFKSDSGVDTARTVHVRSMSNALYITGKMAGIMVMFLLLNLCVLALTMVVTLFAKDVSIVPMAYILYPLLVSVPTLLFICGLAFFCMVLIRNQALTVMLLLAWIAAVLFYFGGRYHLLFDFTAQHLPLLYSDFTGFAGTVDIIYHRLMYVLAGIALTAGSILLFRRLPQSRTVTITTVIILAASVVGMGVSGRMIVSEDNAGVVLRDAMRELNHEHAADPRVTVTACDIKLTHTGNEIEASAAMKVENRTGESIDRFLFSLNPGLEIVSVGNGSEKWTYTRDHHLCFVSPPKPLSPGEECQVVFTYRGAVDDNAAYLDIPEEDRDDTFQVLLYRVRKKYSFIMPEYLLLTAENNWYPVSGVPYGSVFPSPQHRDFVNFTVTVKTLPGLTALSQGAMKKEGDDTFTFTPEHPLPQVSVVAGPFEERSLTVDDVTYSLYIGEGHDYFSQYFKDLGDELSEIISDQRGNVERNLGLIYPFTRLTLIETPAQFSSYDRLWTTTMETVQPEQVLLPERGFMTMQSLDFAFMKRGMSRGFGRRREMSEEEITRFMAERAIRSILTSDNEQTMFSRFRGRVTGMQLLSPARIISMFMPESLPRYSVIHNFYTYVNHVWSEDYPVLNAVLDKYIHSRQDGGRGRMFRFFTGITDAEKASMLLADTDLPGVLADPSDYDMLPAVLELKGKQLIAEIKVHIDERSFDEFLDDYFTDSRFKETSSPELAARIGELISTDYDALMAEWYRGQGLPLFHVDNIKGTAVIEGDQTAYQVTFTVYNPAEVGGVLSAGMNRPDAEQAYIQVDGGTAKEVTLTFDENPRGLAIDTVISGNLPASIQHPVTIENEPEQGDNQGPGPGRGGPPPMFMMGGGSSASIGKKERILSEPPAIFPPGEIIVDNEDPGFSIDSQAEESFLMRMLANNSDNGYTDFQVWRPPARWRAAAGNDFYGIYRRTVHFVKAGEGSQTVSWKATLPESGSYDVYFNIPENPFARWMRRRGGRTLYGDFHLKVKHDDGVDEVEMNIGESEAGWYYVGSYYFSGGQTTVELSDKSDGRVVYADAVRFVKKQ